MRLINEKSIIGPRKANRPSGIAKTAQNKKQKKKNKRMKMNSWKKKITTKSSSNEFV